MSDWKSTYGVTDDGAFGAGVYGAPTSTYDISRAKEETDRISRSYSESCSSSYQNQYQPAEIYAPYSTHPYTSISSRVENYPRNVKSVGSSRPSLLPRLVYTLLVILVMGGAAVIFASWSASALLFAESFFENRVATLDTRHYERLSSVAVKLSQQPTTRLYADHGLGASHYWEIMKPSQRTAVAAAWIRYTRDPVSFDRLAKDQRSFVFATFKSYLDTLARGGDVNAAADAQLLRSRAR